MDETLPAGWPAYSLFTALRNEEGLPLAWVWSPVPCPAHGPGAAGIAAPAWAFAWTTYLVPAWSMDQAGGSRDRPLMVLLAWAMCLVRRMDRGLSGWSTMTVRPYMVLRVGRMIGPACGPLVHSHDVDRKRAGHVGGPPASTWSIWPLGPRSRTPPMAHTAGPDRGPGRLGWPMVLVDAVFRVRSARPADGGYATTTPRPFYSSCRAPVNSMSQTIIRTPGHSRHRRACIPCRTRRPCRVLSRRPFSSVPRLRGTGRSPLRPR